MLKSFLQYINENSQDSPKTIQYASDVINCIQKIGDTGGEYNEIRELQYNEEDTFDLVIQIQKNSNPDFNTDLHFKDLQWEELNFRDYGFAVDANMYIDKKDLMVPEIVVTLIIDPNREDSLYDELNYRLIDIITHELNHTNQIGWNREPFNVRPSSHPTRNSSKRSFKYFLLPDEIESYVIGAYTRSKEEGIAIDKVFDKYLSSFLESGEMTKSEYAEVFKAWLIHTLENFPDAKISINDNKISKIVNSI